jgi:hypothetical protein
VNEENNANNSGGLIEWPLKSKVASVSQSFLKN